MRAIRPPGPDDVVRGQYQGYRQRRASPPIREVETFAAVRLKIDSWRWSGVPILIRAGKSLPRPPTEVLVRFRRAARDRPPIIPLDCSQDYVRIRFNPEEIIAIGAVVRKEGEDDGFAAG